MLRSLGENALTGANYVRLISYAHRGEVRSCQKHWLSKPCTFQFSPDGAMPWLASAVRTT